MCRWWWRWLPPPRAAPETVNLTSEFGPGCRCVVRVRAVAVRWVLLCVGWVSCAHAPQAPAPSMPHPLLGLAFPAAQPRSLSGSALTLPDPLATLTVVDVFAAYCAPCGPRLEALQALGARHPQARIAGVSVDELPSLAHRQTQRYGVTFPVVHDPARTLSGRLRVRELPITFIVNKAGTVVWVGGPSHTGAQVEEAVVAALNGRLDLLGKEPTK